MKIDKTGINEEEKHQAQRLLNQLRGGQRVFGNPAEGLKKSLRELDVEDEKSQTEFELQNVEKQKEIKKVKAGINGEEGLANYLSKILKLEEDLEGIVAFASLSIGNNEEQMEEKGYIADTDFLLIYGSNIMILDAKNVKTNPENPVFMQEGALCNMNSTLLDEIIPSTNLWGKYFERMQIDIEDITEYLVIYNKVGATILKNGEWHQSLIKPIHVSDIKDILKEWVRDKENTLPLKLVTKLSDGQIRKEKSDINLSQAFKKFKL